MARRVLFLILGLLTIASTAFAQWITDGTPICTQTSIEYTPQIISDLAGGALISWEDTHAGNGGDMYIQRVSPTGVAMWTSQGIAVYAGPANQQEQVMVPDGTGGAILVWVDYRDSATNDADIYCRRVSKNGVLLWSANGVALTTAPGGQYSVAAVTDGAGGAIVAWRDFRNGVDYDVYAQRVNASGVVQWAAGGVAIGTEVEDQNIPLLTTDGAGGAIITWFDRRSSPNADIYAQRVNSAGVPQWTDDGVPLCTLAGVQRNPFPVPDGSGGAIIAWWDSRSGTFDIYAQRVNSAGVAQWSANGVPVCTAAGDQSSPLVVASGTSDAIIVWEDLRGSNADIFAQKLNTSGAPQWTANGVKVCGATSDQFSPAIVSDGAGGAIFAWSDERDGAGLADIYTQRIVSAGTANWFLDGVLLCAESLDQQDVQLASDGSSGAIVTWKDNRAGNGDIYAQRVLSTGAVPIVTAVGARTPSLHASNVYPNPFSGTALLDLEVATPVTVRIDVFDVAGRRVRSAVLPAAATGARRLEIDGRDDVGRLLPSGVYFYRVKAAGETITRKMVIAR